MPTITIGGVAYEVYDTLANAKIYFRGAVGGSVFLAASASDANQALITTARVFDYTNWLGAPTDLVTPQPLAWPRSGLIDRNGDTLDSATIPQDVLNGNFEYALSLISDPTVQTDNQRGSNLKKNETTQRVEAAVTTTTKQEFFLPTIGRVAPFPTIVQNYIGLWLEGTNIVTGIASGTDQVSVIVDVDFGFNAGGIP